MKVDSTIFLFGRGFDSRHLHQLLINYMGLTNRFEHREIEVGPSYEALRDLYFNLKEVDPADPYTKLFRFKERFKYEFRILFREDESICISFVEDASEVVGPGQRLLMGSFNVTPGGTWEQTGGSRPIDLIWAVVQRNLI